MKTYRNPKIQLTVFMKIVADYFSADWRNRLIVWETCKGTQFCTFNVRLMLLWFCIRLWLRKLLFIIWYWSYPSIVHPCADVVRPAGCWRGGSDPPEWSLNSPSLCHWIKVIFFPPWKCHALMLLWCGSGGGAGCPLNAGSVVRHERTDSSFCF